MLESQNDRLKVKNVDSKHKSAKICIEYKSARDEEGKDRGRSNERQREENRKRQRTGISGGKNSLLNKWYPDNYITTCKGIRL